ncbi:MULTISPECIES: FxSxx-COOH cyclophane-containing RiPP peptide [unclassified Streptomyces]|uniref:FxSxx-COOH cyclophane-containing RiPP peptide n=1 Tax=unclassified Streptomyces TaxID=2593676 RepID=UPI002E28F284|nr:FxSxx-COOH cyclophane-containing RiPP peptide [Streptomyces sp. NBC_00223]
MAEQPHGGAGDSPGGQDLDLLGMDLESLRTADHPVLAALVSDLRERVTAPGAEALWGFDNSM